MDNKRKITSFRDLVVYQESYANSLKVADKILPKLPFKEKYDLTDQLSRSSKAVPRLIAEGYAKKHQRAGFQKYLDDAMAESNETIVSLEQVKDIYNIEPIACSELIDSYDKIGRQLYRLSEVWTSFKKRSRQPLPSNDTGVVTDNL